MDGIPQIPLLYYCLRKEPTHVLLYLYHVLIVKSISDVIYSGCTHDTAAAIIVP